MAEVYKLMDEGAAHAAASRWAEATSAFDKVLARSPVFERRKEMAPAYVAHAKTLEEKDPAAALEMLRKALRLDPKGEGENPMSDADLDRKFLSNCEPIVGKDKCQRLLEAVWGFDRLDSLAVFYRW